MGGPQRRDDLHRRTPPRQDRLDPALLVTTSRLPTSPIAGSRLPATGLGTCPRPRRVNVSAVVGADRTRAGSGDRLPGPAWVSAHRDEHDELVEAALVPPAAGRGEHPGVPPAPTPSPGRSAPSAGTSALVWAVSSAVPARTELWSSRPFAVVRSDRAAPGPSSSGWWTTDEVRTDPPRASSATACTELDREEHRGGPPAPGSPQTSPTRSQGSAQEGSYQLSRSAVTSASRTRAA